MEFGCLKCVLRLLIDGSATVANLLYGFFGALKDRDREREKEKERGRSRDHEKLEERPSKGDRKRVRLQSLSLLSIRSLATSHLMLWACYISRKVV